jgi:signal transduction histidine kinase
VDPKRLAALVLYFIAGWFCPAVAIEPPSLILRPGVEISGLASQGLYFFDSTGTLSFQEVALREDLELVKNAVPNMKATTGAHWLMWKFVSETSENLTLHLANPAIDEVSFLVADSNLLLLKSMTAGMQYPYYQREIDHQDFLVSLPTARHKELRVFLRIKSSRQALLPIRVGTFKNISQTLLLKEHVFGVYAGIILVMILYNLFVYFSVRDKNYLLYIFYIFSVGFTQLVLNGYGQKFLWPSDILLAQQSINWSGILSGLGVLFFVKYFLRTRENAAWFDKLLQVFGAVYVVAFLLGIFGMQALAYNVINVVAAFGSLCLLGAGLQIALKGYRPARFFVFAFSFFLLGVIIYVLRDVGVLPYNIATNYALITGSAIEVILLSLALADRINMLTFEKEEARRHELEILKENERLILEQKIMLEQKVEERTEDLKSANRDLSNAMQNLKNAQTQLVNAEKMASLGQLTAGIAHEINNPINFVSGNISPLKRDIADLKNLIEKYETLAAQCENPEIHTEMMALKKSLDIETTAEEIEDLMNGIHEGALRTGEIVKSLRNFSRLDEDDSKFANVHDGIDSTLVILRNHTKNNISIDREFDPNMGNIECYPGKLNQVFSNLIMNAIQALREIENKEDGRIVIHTTWREKDIVIRIIDNGPGIPEKIKARIFEPFFTTKEVGEGTGLGLSIVYSIIESHRGQIEVKDPEDGGTEFCITLPKTLH